MRAIVCHDFEESSVEEVERPTAAAGEILLRVKRVQLSVTECNLYRGEEIAYYEAIRDRLARGGGRLFGHEFCGTVVEQGASVTAFESGDRVYAPGKLSCGECVHCARGFELYCSDKTYVGYDTPGALAEYVALPASVLCAVPGAVSDAETAALQPLASSVVGVEEASIQVGDVGTGVMGYQYAQLALLRGASRVFAVDVDEMKLEIAAERDLEPINATAVDPAEEIRTRTDGIGADVVFEAVGGAQRDATSGSDPIAQAFGAVRRGGEVVQVSYVIGDVTLTPRQLRSKSVDWINPTTGVTSFTPNASTAEYAAELVARGDVSIEKYVTHELDRLESFERAVEITLCKDEHDALGPAQLVLE
jgi:L-iditol 2-dehydrogenase